MEPHQRLQDVASTRWVFRYSLYLIRDATGVKRILYPISKLQHKNYKNNEKSNPAVSSLPGVGNACRFTMLINPAGIHLKLITV